MALSSNQAAMSDNCYTGSGPVLMAGVQGARETDRIQDIRSLS